MAEINHAAVVLAKILAIPITPVPELGTHPDDALMAACAAFDNAEREYVGFHYGPDAIEDDDERQEAIEPNEQKRRDLVQLICSLRATTLDGHLARARVVMLEDLDLNPAEDAESEYFNVSLLGALLRDLAAHAGARRPA